MNQSATVAFLASGQAFTQEGSVEVIETHGAYVFLCGDTALKLKRAVKYDYMDLSTVELRRAMIARELDLNKSSAPEIYRDMLPVTHDAKGLVLGGTGPVVDWILRMWRFPAENELEQIVAHGGFDDGMAIALGEAIATYHARAPVRPVPGRRLVSEILGELSRVFAQFPGADGTERIGEWKERAERGIDKISTLLDQRGTGGHVRRGHGDLHLRNLVLIDGRPVLYDALEFDETLGTCDVLYDTAFLVMDLCHRGLRRQACRVLDAWLRSARGAEDASLAALPLFLSVRAAIRAMVLLQTDAARGQSDRSGKEVAAYLDLACAALQPVPPRLVAVGGYSGSGKSVLAHALSPAFGALPGAALLSSDLERKVDMARTKRLDAEAYGADSRAVVYRGMFARAAAILAGDHSVLLDATFVDPAQRRAAEEIAAKASVPFFGLWLDASPQVLETRVSTRSGDASDADLNVLHRQLTTDLGMLTWQRVDASGDAASVLSVVWERLGLQSTFKPASE